MCFEQEMTEYLNELKGQALKFTKNEAKAEDLVQDTFEKALKYKDSFTSGTNLRAWLYTILRNTFINQYRRKKRHNEYIEKEHQIQAEEVKRTDDFTKDILGLDEAKNLLDELEGHLNPDFFDVLVLVDVQNKSYKEASALMDIPVGTIMSRLHRARKHSREYLLDNYDSEILAEVLPRDTLQEHRRIA